MKSDITQIVVPFHVAATGEEEVQAVADVVRSGWLTMGPRTQEFEQSFAAAVGSRHAIAVSSCTAALHLALEAIGIAAGDEVLVPTTTFTATAEAVCYLGARPVLCDVQRDALNLDPADCARRITPRTRAIIPVHFAGVPCDMEEVRELAWSYALPLIEDAAHAFPSSYRGSPIGAIGDITAFSFYATKTLTTGEGGMVTTNNDQYADRMRLMRLHGIGRDAWKRYSSEGSWYYEVREAGFKYNLTDMQSAIGLVQLSRAQELLSARERIARQYDEAFGTLNSLEIPTRYQDRDSAHHLYVLRLNLEYLSINRDQFIAELKQQGISASVHFIPLHLHPFYQERFSYKGGDFPVAETEYGRCLSLPLFPTMTPDQVAHVIDSVIRIAQENA